jgi:ABC-type uncharacterized transport system permease subunit
MVYLGYLMVPLTWYYINRTRPGLHLRAVGDNPTAADSMGLNVYRLRYMYVVVGGMLAGLAGGTISLVASPGWFSELTTSGQGWIAVGLVIFAQWDPFRAACLRLRHADLTFKPAAGFYQPSSSTRTSASSRHAAVPHHLVLVIGSRGALRSAWARRPPLRHALRARRARELGPQRAYNRPRQGPDSL